MKSRGVSVWCVLLTSGVVSLGAGGCCSAPDNIGVTSELNGLKVSIQSAQRSAAGVDLLLVFERSTSATWRLNPLESVQPNFWDDAGALIVSAQPVMVALDPNFVAFEVDRTTATVQVTPPSDACAVSLALGVSGLETPKVKVP